MEIHVRAQTRSACYVGVVYAFSVVLVQPLVRLWKRAANLFADDADAPRAEHKEAECHACGRTFRFYDSQPPDACPRCGTVWSADE